MDIFHQKLNTDGYRLTITSDTPILVTYYDLIAMADDLSMSPSEVALYLGKANCPTPINHNAGADGALEDGIWFYDRLIAFFDWIANGSAYAPMVTGVEAKTVDE